MAISRGPRRLAGLQRTRAAYANEAALAISGRAARRGRRLRDPGARPAPPHIAGSALFGARLRPGGPGAALAAAAARTQAQAANFECLRRRPRPAPRPPAAARRPSRSGRPRAGLRPAPLSLRGARAPSLLLSGRGGPAGRLPPLVLGVSPHAGPAWAQVVSQSPDLLSGLVSALRAPPAAGPARRLAAGAERSAHAGVAGLRQDQLSGSEAARAARLLPSPPLGPPPLRSHPCLPAAAAPPPTPGPSTPERPPRPPPPPGLPRPFARPPGLRAACGSLNPGTGRGPRGFASHPQFRSLMGAVPGACGVGRERRVPGGLATESSKSTKVPRVAHRVLDFWG
ncbi:proline-rich protein 36-like [Bos javanicus]|uniref:proline-rich protein 36-like n=1 Tax=Bos javanicus TaxID=9906 RepID=UPI002AA87653|nr:proline-rich protein 36-like [Bos javanicus]